MATKGRMSAAKAKAGKSADGKKYFDASSGSGSENILAAVWGQLEPLDRVAREKIARWGDSLPSLVSPDLAGRFEAAYEALEAQVRNQDVKAVNQIVGQLLRAWDVLEEAAVRAGHQPLPKHAYAIECEGEIICIAMHGAVEIRKAHPDWIVYSFEDAARVMRHSFVNDFYAKAQEAFPNAKIVSVTNGDDVVKYDIEDEIPF